MPTLLIISNDRIINRLSLVVSNQIRVQLSDFNVLTVGMLEFHQVDR